MPITAPPLAAAGAVGSTLKLAVDLGASSPSPEAELAETSGAAPFTCAAVATADSEEHPKAAAAAGPAAPAARDARDAPAAAAAAAIDPSAAVEVAAADLSPPTGEAEEEAEGSGSSRPLSPTAVPLLEVKATTPLFELRRRSASTPASLSGGGRDALGGGADGGSGKACYATMPDLSHPHTLETATPEAAAMAAAVAPAPSPLLLERSDGHGGSPSPPTSSSPLAARRSRGLAPTAPTSSTPLSRRPLAEPAALPAAAQSHTEAAATLLQAFDRHGDDSSGQPLFILSRRAPPHPPLKPTGRILIST